MKIVGKTVDGGGTLVMMGKSELLEGLRGWMRWNELKKGVRTDYFDFQSYVIKE